MTMVSPPGYRVSYYTRTGSRISRHIVPLPSLVEALIRAVREWHHHHLAGPVIVWEGPKVLKDPGEVEEIALENWEEV